MNAPLKTAASEPTKQTLDILNTLIGFNTVSRESNLGLIEWVRDYLERYGAVTRLTYDAERRKANLFATIGGAAGNGKFGTVFSGHTDVVPVKGQNWDSDPFVARIADGKLFGRGACDMKGFIAVTLSRLPFIDQNRLHTPLHFSFSYDEEVGCLGVRELLADLKKNEIRPTGVIIGEPTSMQAVIAHKGKRSYRCSVHGHAAHSSCPHLGINSIDFAAMMQLKIRDIARRVRENEANDYDFDVPYSSIVTTLSNGGSAPNIIPDKAEFVFEHRFLPGIDPREVFEEVKAYAEREVMPQMTADGAQGRIEFETLTAYPGMNTPSDDPIVTSALRILGSERARKVGFGTEGGLFFEAGMPAVICGPGDIVQAHKPNEFVTLEQLARCESFFDNFIASANLNPA
ncbi:acetylornithine deacetylase [Herbaspirillum sp. LeCh32-8]|uniref:acetylornithine deacetylase n=1 Tax=Herbaspirillum sp. LeCh32-8 TaxID=2821356 RepID=UPI001AE37DF7|nr:acetylornithine deacetylase [Herbaspirillum sp. LeCh32-8]MBP0596507.1 acetylornithine deacetylase [Herbaspirillum sp. LeCh32-8]